MDVRSLHKRMHNENNLCSCLCKSFMANFELKYISLYRRDKTKMFLSLLLLMTWTGSEQELLDFMNDLSKKYPSIKFRIQRLTNKN